jgi:hypothetical protein
MCLGIHQNTYAENAFYYKKADSSEAARDSKAG